MNISYFDLCRTILEGGSLDSKLVDLSQLQFDDWKSYTIPALPGREARFQMSDKRTKFPKNFERDEARARALHFFANHELLAMEMMAGALLYFPHQTAEEIKLKRGILQTLKEEQKHFKLYLHRMKDFGLEFGDLPLNDFFWRQMHAIKTVEEYLAMMALTFEMANLDFMQIYHDAFLQVEDEKSATILSIVLQDEISHVALGVNYLGRKKGEKDLWDYYQTLLPPNLTPVRSKGPTMNKNARLEAGVDEAFLLKAEHFTDNYAVTQRKEWKNS